MPSLLETLTTLLAERRAAPILAERIGGCADDTEAAIGPALARIIDGLATLADDADGADLVAHLLDHHDTPVADELDAFLDRAPTVSGNVILDRVFGAERGLVVIGLAYALGLAPSLVGRLLPRLAPVVTAELARRRDVNDLDDWAVVELLVRDRVAIAQAGVLEGTTFGSRMIEPDRRETAGLRGSRPGARRGGGHRDRLLDQAGETVSLRRGPPTPTPTPGPWAERARIERSAGGGDDDCSDEAQPNGTIAILEEGEAGGRTTAPATPPKADSSEVDSSEADSSQAITEAPEADRGDDGIIVVDDGPTEDPIGSVVEQPNETEPQVHIQVDDDDEVEDEDEDERRVGAERQSGEPGDAAAETAAPGPVDARGFALAWLGWAIGAVVLVLLLAWLLSTCGASASRTEEAGPVIGVGTGGAGTSISVAEGNVADRVDGSPASMATRAPAGPATTGAGNGSDASVAGSVTGLELQRAVDATLRGTEVSGVVVDDRVTLTGTVADERDRDGFEARIAVLLGVAAIDNRITIDDPAAEAATAPDVATAAEPVAPGTTLNELLSLDPVTFTSGSADLTDQGRAVLDLVAAHLVERPDLPIDIIGHTDSDGGEDDNLELSQQRSDAVRRYLIEADVDATRLTAIGRGEAEPRVANDSLGNKAINRRIEFVVR